MPATEMTEHISKNFVAGDKHPMRIVKGQAKGKMPHEMTKNAFDRWLILNGMEEPLYWQNIYRGEAFVRKETHEGFKRVTKGRLNPDQRGWAQHDHPLHFHQGLPWLINKEKPSRPIPDYSFMPQRNIHYPTNCQCGGTDINLYGKAYDGRNLVRCSNCKVIMAT